MKDDDYCAPHTPTTTFYNKMIGTVFSSTCGDVFSKNNLTVMINLTITVHCMSTNNNENREPLDDASLVLDLLKVTHLFVLQVPISFWNTSSRRRHHRTNRTKKNSSSSDNFKTVV